MLAATLGRPLGVPFTTAHDEALREADSATKAEDDSQAKRVLDDAAARCERQKAELLAAGTSDLAGKLAQMEQRQKKLEDRGQEIESEPMRLQQQVDRQQALLDGGRLEPVRVEEARGLKARAEIDQKVAQEVAHLWRQRADGLLAELAQAIGAAKPALGAGKGDVASAAESLARGIGIAQRLDAMVQEVPPLMKQVDELQRLRNEARKVSVEAVPPAASAVDHWLGAALSSLSGEDYKTTRQKLGDVVWLLDAKLLQDWAARRSETASLLGRLEQLPKPKDATDGGPVALLSDVQSRVEAQVAAADRDADFAGWSKTLESGRSLATAIEARAVLETELEAEIQAASGKVPTGAWDSLQGDRAVLLAALWQRDEAVAGQRMQAIRATKVNRGSWLNLAKEVGAVRSAVEAARKQGMAQAAEPELHALAERIGSSETTQEHLREALAGAQDAVARSYAEWAASQPIGKDDAVGKQIETMNAWALTPATKVAVDGEAASLRERVLQRKVCAEIAVTVRGWNGASFARDLMAFQAEVAKVEALDQERVSPACTRARLGEIVGELSQLRATAETAFVDGATELARSRLPSQLSSAQEIVQWLEKDFGTNAKVKVVASAAAAAAERERPWRELQQAGFRKASGSKKDPSTGFPTRIEHVASGAVLALIPKGEFRMGSPSSEADRGDDEQQHRRVIRSAFYLGVTELTQSQWEKVTGSNPSYFKGANLPVEVGELEDCQEYLKQAGGGLRLPSEAEWEYACRGNTTTPFSFGGTITTDQVNYDGNNPYGNGRQGQYRERTVPAGSLPANRWGLHEMHGNVWEWCEDGYADYPASGTEEAARAAGARVLRGGSWSGFGDRCRAARRNAYSADDRISFVGFRLARTLPR